MPANRSQTITLWIAIVSLVASTGVENPLQTFIAAVPLNLYAITAILLARETGGNLPVIFNRIVNNIRESRKIQQNLDTLTIQGKIQGVVMSILPVAFAFLLYSSNKRIFDNMLASELGRTLLIYAIISETIGAFMIWKISAFKDF